jgi:hypothetical protein
MKWEGFGRKLSWPSFKVLTRHFFTLDLLFTAIGFPPGGSDQYTSTRNTNTTQRKKQNIQYNNKEQKKNIQNKKQTQDK